MAGWEPVSVQIMAGILLGVEVKPHAILLRNLFCLWHPLLGFWPVFLASQVITQANTLLPAKRLLSRVYTPVWGFLPPLPSVLQAWQTVFFLLAGRSQDSKGIKLHHTLSLYFMLLLLSLGHMRRNIRYLRTLQKLKEPQKKLKMTVETPAAFLSMISRCQGSQRNQMLAVERGSQTQLLLIQDKRTT